MTDETNPLLALLQATVDDPEIFDMSGVDDPAAFKIELRQAWSALFDNAAYCWGESFYPEVNHIDRPEILGPVMCKHFSPLSSCWLESFRDAICRVADRKELPKKKSREFLYFMLGVLAASWATYLGIRWGRIVSDESWRD